jgi:hypothetical protein
LNSLSSLQMRPSIAWSSLISLGVINVSEKPPLPARAVRPTRWTYSLGFEGTLWLTISWTVGISSPEIFQSCCLKARVKRAVKVFTSAGYVGSHKNFDGIRTEFCQCSYPFALTHHGM